MDYDDRYNEEDTINPQKKDDENKSFEELTKRDRELVNKIIGDDNYAYEFFHEMCRPLLSKIIWTIYGNNADYEELVNELYVVLKKPNRDGEFWHSLKTFDYRTTLFDWIKTVAVRHFYTPSNETFCIPETLIESGVIRTMFSELQKANYRKYLWFRYIDKLDENAICEKMHLEHSQLAGLYRKAIRQLKSIIENHYPEYLSTMFKQCDVTEVSLENVRELVSARADTDHQDRIIDIYNYLELMPNDRYRYVLIALFLEDKAPDELANEMGTPVSNIYNIKSRALDQLRDIILYSNEISNLEKYINSISDDRKQKILVSIFIKKRSYNVVCSELNMTEVEFKKMKRDAIKEIKKIIFKTKS